MLQELEIELHTIACHKDMALTSQILIYLDTFIDCPYYITAKQIIVTSDRKAVELAIFAGDLRKYGTTKAMTRQNKKIVIKDMPKDI
jgi:hypothetical protein